MANGEMTSIAFLRGSNVEDEPATIDPYPARKVKDMKSAKMSWPTGGACLRANHSRNDTDACCTISYFTRDVY
ncbi:hypothetical protein TNCV_2907861 [Trichonephila clavipes]|nr:hypothetical protein TNCV_2907861 [Trichonephila clavipes]